jgi:hypothetical protein
MGVFFIRRDGCRLICTRVLTLECKTKPEEREEVSDTKTHDALSPWLTDSSYSCCLKLFQLTLIAFSILLFRVCPECAPSVGTRLDEKI